MQSSDPFHAAITGMSEVSDLTAYLCFTMHVNFLTCGLIVEYIFCNKFCGFLYSGKLAGFWY